MYYSSKSSGMQNFIIRGKHRIQSEMLKSAALLKLVKILSLRASIHGGCYELQNEPKRKNTNFMTVQK